MTLACDRLVNAAGHGAPGLAQGMAGYDARLAPRAFFARGNYFTLTGRSPFARLIYPVPQPGGLGVHLTLDLGGQTKFGPDVEWIERLDYAVDPARGETFYAAIRRYWPALCPTALWRRGYAGVRPKIVPPEAGTQDFLIQGPRAWARRARASVRDRIARPSPPRSPSRAACARAAGGVRRKGCCAGAVRRLRDRDVRGAQRRPPAVAQIAEIGVAGIDTMIDLGELRVAPHHQNVDRHADAELERIVESIEMRPIFSAS